MKPILCLTLGFCLLLFLTMACAPAASAPPPTAAPAPTSAPQPTSAPAPTSALQPTSAPTGPTDAPTNPTADCLTEPSSYIVPTKNEIELLNETFEKYGVSCQDFDFEGTVTFALPGKVLSDPDKPGVVMISVPRMKSPANLDSTPIGLLFAERTLRISNPALPEGSYDELTQGSYLVLLENNVILFIDKDGKPATGKDQEPIRLNPLKLAINTREVTPPEATITLEDLCQSWDDIQYCYQPSARLAMSDFEMGELQKIAQEALDDLISNQKVDKDEVDVKWAIPDVEGIPAVKRQQASFIGVTASAITTKDQPREPTEGELMGIFAVLLPLQNPGTDVPDVPEGEYSVRAAKVNSNWVARLTRATGDEVIDVPLTLVEMRGKGEEATRSLGVLSDFCFLWMCTRCQQRHTCRP